VGDVERFAGIGDAGGLRQQPAHDDRPASAPLGQPAADGVVEAEEPLLGELQRDRRGDGLGDAPERLAARCCGADEPPQPVATSIAASTPNSVRQAICRRY
jgi:hypothetical protein